MYGVKAVLMHVLTTKHHHSHRFHKELKYGVSCFHISISTTETTPQNLVGDIMSKITKHQEPTFDQRLFGSEANQILK